MRRSFVQFIKRQQLNYCSTGLGGGAGRGGGGGGSVREAGGLLGEIGAAREEMYFRKQNQALLEKIRRRKLKEIEYHKEQIARHQEAIDRAQAEAEEIAEAEITGTTISKP